MSVLAGFLALCAALSAPPAAANSDFVADIIADGSAGIGAVLRTEQPLYRGDKWRSDVLPLYLYEGDYAYLHSYRIGLKFATGPGQRVDLFLSRRLEGFPFQDVPASLAGMTMRDTGADIGVSYGQRFDWGRVFGEYLHDSSGASSGSELRAGYSYERRSGRAQLVPYFMLAARDAKLNAYYYGVLPSESTPSRPAYEPGSGVNGTLGLNARYDLTNHWHFLAGISATRWAGTVRRSPIVEDRLQLAVFGGFAYEFAPSTPKPGWDHAPLIFKVFHGESSDCNLMRIMALSCTTTGTIDKSRVDSIEIGRPFAEEPHGWPVSIVGYLGLLRHEERGLQPDFWQVNIYLKAFYWGFPWSERVRTRIGFGAGLSQAQSVPYAEARDQARRGGNSTKLIQYLDPTIDASIGDIFGHRAWRETYVGLGVSHRSGVFKAIRLFDNAYGGSNYIYTYVEWKM